MRSAPFRTPTRIAVLMLVAVVAIGACGGSTGSGDAPPSNDGLTTPAATSETAPTVTAAEPTVATEDEPAAQQYPDVVDAVVRQDGETWTFDVTMSSPYDSPDRYADGWRVIAPDGTELGFRLLTHDHASEQPFTRSLDGVEIPDDVDTVTIEGRDQANGFGGETFEVTLPR